RDRLGITHAANVVLYVGRVTDEKNIAFLADAWRAYRNQNVGTTTVFAVVGSGNLEEFRQRAGPGVHTLGPLYGEMLSAMYRVADVFWTASVNETLGQVVLEAQASGVATVVSDRGAARENVDDGRTGRVLAVDDPDHWAHELRMLLNNRERCSAMGHAARAYAESHTIESSYRHYWALHEEMLPAIDPTTLQRDCRVAPIGGREPAPEGWGVPSTHLSDYHAGKRSKKIPKEAALRAACRRSAERGAKLFLHGDFLDTRPPQHKSRADLTTVRRALADFELAPALYLEGNHDYEFGRNQQIEGIFGCPVAPSLIFRDPDTGLVLTHGHVSELPG